MQLRDGVNRAVTNGKSSFCQHQQLIEGLCEEDGPVLRPDPVGGDSSWSENSWLYLDSRDSR